MEEKIFELGDYSFLKKSKIQRSNLIKVTIFYITSGIVTAFIVFFGVIALFFKSAIPISVGEFFIYIIPISVFLFFGYQCFRLWQRHFQIINSPSRLILNDFEIAIDKKKFSYEDIKIIAGAGDNAAAAIGTGTVGEGACNISLGTSGTIFISSQKFGVDKYNALHSFDHSDGKYHLMGCMLSAASCNKWWMEDILKTKDFASEQENIGALGENKVFFLPYLMGERSPHNDPAARGTFIGMSMDTRREDMTLAILEGVTFGLRDSLEVARSLGIEIKKTMICGGGAKSALWKKLVANIMNVEVEVPVSEEGPGFGAAILVAVGCKEYESVEAAAKSIIKIKERIQPDPELVAKYEKKYQKFRKIYPALKGIFKEIL